MTPEENTEKEAQQYTRGFNDGFKEAKQLYEKPAVKPIAEINLTKEELDKLIEKAKADILANIEAKGEWIRSEETAEDLSGSIETYTRSTCSICNQANGWGEVPYCPWCGAKMETKP